MKFEVILLFALCVTCAIAQDADDLVEDEASQLPTTENSLDENENSPETDNSQSEESPANDQDQDQANNDDVPAENDSVNVQDQNSDEENPDVTDAPENENSQQPNDNANTQNEEPSTEDQASNNEASTDAQDQNSNNENTAETDAIDNENSQVDDDTNSQTNNIDASAENDAASAPNQSSENENPTDNDNTADQDQNNDEEISNSSPEDQNASEDNTVDEDTTSNQPEIPTTETSTSTDAPEFACTDVGRFPDPNSCNKYYFCWDNTHPYAIFTCPRAFNPVTSLCGHDYSHCSLAPNCECDQQVFPVPGDTKSFFECRRNHKSNPLAPAYEVRLENCAKGREFDPDLGYCRLETGDTTSSESNESTGKFECHTVGIFIDFTSDTRYYQCVVKNIAHGILKPIKHKCPKNEIFSGVDMICVPLLPV